MTIHNEDRSEPILRVKDLQTNFTTRAGIVTAVDGVSIDVYQGECLGVVGESGSGKSVTFSSVMGLIKPPGKIVRGSIDFLGQDILNFSNKQYQSLRGKDIAMTMQDALTALNPAYTVGDQIMEVILAHDVDLTGSRRNRKKQAYTKTLEMMELVGIPSPSARMDEYPHQFSGGMRQRIMIAIALACKPKILIADEPTTALDVTIQAQILELIAGIRKDLGMSVVLITHDLGVVSEYCDHVVVMYAGQIVESGPTYDVVCNPLHPYTKGLISSIPDLADLDRVIEPIPGQVPELINIPEGCRFYARCSEHTDACRVDIAMRQISEKRQARCVLHPEESK